MNIQASDDSWRTICKRTFTVKPSYFLVMPWEGKRNTIDLKAVLSLHEQYCVSFSDSAFLLGYYDSSGYRLPPPPYISSLHSVDSSWRGRPWQKSPAHIPSAPEIRYGPKSQCRPQWSALSFKDGCFLSGWAQTRRLQGHAGLKLIFDVLVNRKWQWIFNQVVFCFFLNVVLIDSSR